jgi:hypothetical protein
MVEAHGIAFAHVEQFPLFVPAASLPETANRVDAIGLMSVASDSCGME